jgi:hypothetical protein
MTISLLLTALLAPAPAGELTPLDVKAYRTWKIELPADPFQKVSGSIPVAHAGGDGFPVEPRGQGLAVDTDGDGEVDRELNGRKDPDTQVRHARVVLTGKAVDGGDLRYPVRFKDEGAGWTWASGGALVGQIDGVGLQVIDLNGNGSFHDVGRDAVVVGGTGVAHFLGETLTVGDQLMQVTLEDSDRGLFAEPFDGATGTLDLASDFGGKGVMLSAVVQSVDGRQSFELGAHEGKVTVPEGRYRLVTAALGLGDARVEVDPTRMKAVEVSGDATAKLGWGAPIRATFAYKREGGELTFDPRQVSYVGAGGERWIGWNPIGKSPKFQVKEKDTGDVLVDVVFPGSC